MSTPMKNVLPPASEPRIWSTEQVGDVVIWGDVGLTGSVVNPKPAGSVHHGLPDHAQIDLGLLEDRISEESSLLFPALTTVEMSTEPVSA
jgi:hypothetical protein